MKLRGVMPNAHFPRRRGGISGRLLDGPRLGMTGGQATASVVASWRDAGSCTRAPHVVPRRARTRRHRRSPRRGRDARRRRQADIPRVRATGGSLGRRARSVLRRAPSRPSGRSRRRVRRGTDRRSAAGRRCGRAGPRRHGRRRRRAGGVPRGGSGCGESVDQSSRVLGDDEAELVTQRTGLGASQRQDRVPMPGPDRPEAGRSRSTQECEEQRFGLVVDRVAGHRVRPEHGPASVTGASFEVRAVGDVDVGHPEVRAETFGDRAGEIGIAIGRVTQAVVDVDGGDLTACGHGQRNQRAGVRCSAGESAGHRRSGRRERAAVEEAAGVVQCPRDRCDGATAGPCSGTAWPGRRPRTTR